ncbi:MAG: hypothetical protein V3T40_03035 [Nitrososphaerales archaeon]
MLKRLNFLCEPIGPHARIMDGPFIRTYLAMKARIMTSVRGRSGMTTTKYTRRSREGILRCSLGRKGPGRRR